MTNADLSRLINSDEVQSKINAPKEGTAKAVLKCNPLKSASAMEKLNPAAATIKKRAAEESKKKTAKKAKKSAAVIARMKSYYKSMVAEE